MKCQSSFSSLRMLLTFIYGLIGVALVLWLWKEASMGICVSKKALDGRVVVITGGTSGIGFETALDLAKRGARVVFTGRTESKGLRVQDTLRRLSRNNEVVFKRLDLASQKDTKRFALELQSELPQIHFLINNAGLSAGDPVSELFSKASETCKTMTEDGFELTMASNFLGHVTLTEALMDNLKAGAVQSGDKSRVIHVASNIHVLGRLDFSNPDLNLSKKGFNSLVAYYDSKLAQICYSNALAQRLCNSMVESVSLHPGFVQTNLFESLHTFPSMVYVFVATVIFGKTSRQGAQTTIEAVVSDKSLNGKYLSDCREAWLVARSRIGNPEQQKVFYNKVLLTLGLHQEE